MGEVFLLIGTKSEHWVKTDTDQTGFRKSHYGSDSVMTFFYAVRVNSLFTGLFSLSVVVCCANRRCNL